MRTRIAAVAMAGLAACARPGAPGADGWIAREELRPEVFRMVQVVPARPRVGDHVWMAAVLVNRGPRPFAFTDPCYDDVWGERALPLPAAARAVELDTGLQGQVTCLGITQRTLQPGDTAILSERRFGPLTRAGVFPVFVALYYGPRATVDTATVHLTVRPRR